MMERAMSVSRRDVRARTGTVPRAVFVAALVLSLAVTAAGGHLWASSVDRQDAGSYRYRFERPHRGSVKRVLEGEIAFLQTRISQNPDGGLDLAALAGTYLKMARATGDLKWYLLAEQTARRSLANLPHQNQGALLALARVAEARHDFAEAIRLATLAGTGPEALSILVTANLATGRVDEAGRAADLLTRTAPGLGSSVLRALVGEARGNDATVLADLQQAIAAEEPGEVGSSAWARTLLGRFHYRRGRWQLASDLYREVLRILPQHPLALVHLAELEMRQGRTRQAERHLTQVVTITRASPNVYDHAVLRGLARLQELRGQHARAAALWADAEARLRQDVTTGQFGHRRELARLLLERGRPQDVGEAVALMEQELQVRQDAETLEVYAWALQRAGRLREARRSILRALRWGIRDARLYHRAATIEQALGDRTAADRFLALMRETDPTFDRRAQQVLGVER